MKATSILIVDDSKIDRMVLQKAFQKTHGESFQVTEAGDALSAIADMQSKRVDAVFLDINMPGHDGFHVLRAIRSDNSGTWPLVFMYSSSSHPDDIAKAYEHQATAYIAKPNDMAHVQDMVKSCGNLIRRACSLSPRAPGLA